MKYGNGIEREEANKKYEYELAKRIIAKDLEHSENEERFYCHGKISKDIVTVRLTHINNKVRIIGAG